MQWIVNSILIIIILWLYVVQIDAAFLFYSFHKQCFWEWDYSCQYVFSTWAHEWPKGSQEFPISSNHVYRQRFTALILEKLCEPLKKKKKIKNHFPFINRQIPKWFSSTCKSRHTHTKNCLIILCRFYNIMCLTSINTTHSVISYPQTFTNGSPLIWVMSCALHLSRSPHYIKALNSSWLSVKQGKRRATCLSLGKEGKVIIISSELDCDSKTLWDNGRISKQG